MLKEIDQRVIVIFTYYRDFPVINVCDWITHFGRKFIRINKIGDTELDEYKISNNQSGLRFKLNGSEVSACWMRKNPQISLSEKISEFKRVATHLKMELKDFINYLYVANQSNCKTLGVNSQYSNPFDVNKIKSLLVAESVGLKTPDTIITTSKNDILEFLIKHKRIISKPLCSPDFLYSSSESFGMYTSLITCEKDIEDSSEIILPSIVQPLIEKKYEIRSFFIEGEFYSAAIFSQNDDQTKIDFRVYNSERPNRIVPFVLPKEVESKLAKFMDLMGLNTGSFDLIVSPENEYVFLEINPVGEFQMISTPCNYRLDKRIAKYLIS